MKRQRLAGIEKEILRVVSKVLLEEVKNPNIKGIVSVTDVSVTEDLKFADTYFSVMTENEVEKQNVLKALEEIKGFLRKRVAEEIEIRYVPEIRVKIDNSIDNAMRINKILNDIKG